MATSFPRVAHAGSGVFTSGGPYGGEIRALAVNPANPATLYAGTPGGRVFKSTDGGKSWTFKVGLTPTSTSVLDASVNALAIDPSTPTTLYAATGYFDVYYFRFGGGVHKSTDSGGTWIATGLVGASVGALVVDPVSPSTLYAATSDGVFRSTDAGATWAAANTGLSSPYVRALAIDPVNPSNLYAGTSDAGVFKSTDSGGTWAAAGLAGQNVQALAVNPKTPSTLYAGTFEGGLFKSIDSGGTWAAANTGPTDLFVRALAINPATPSTLYAGIGRGVFKSTDSGGTWATSGLASETVFALAINPSTNSTLYAGTYRGGVFKSTDSGGTWAAANTGLLNLDVLALAINPSTLSTLYAGAGYGGLFKSSDSGLTWAASNMGLFDPHVSALAINPTVPSTLYAGSFNGLVYKSTDSGGSWAITGLEGDFESGDVLALAIDPANPSTLYAGTPFGGVVKSTDSGGTWTAAQLAGEGVLALAINPAASSTLYAGTWGSGVFKSTDSGGTWAAAGLAGQIVLALAINPASPSTLYAGTSDAGVFKSTDSGSTWASANSGLTNVFVSSLTINPSNPTTLYAGTHGGGVFRSTDAGGTWEAVNTGLPSLPVNAVALDPTGATTLYAGLASGSVWQSTPAMPSITSLLPASAHSPGANGAFYTTDVSVANTGDSAASFTLKFLGNNRDGSNGPEKSFGLEAGKSTTFLDVLSSVFEQTSNFGAIRITSNSSTLNVVSVTSTPGFGGTFGQTIPAVDASDLIPAGSSRSILYIREGDGFRSNLVLASNANVSRAVDAVLVSPAGAALAAKSYSVPPNGMTQINRVVRDMGVSGQVTGARLVLSSSTSGAAFAAFVSVIDESTNDPTSVIAQAASVSGSAPYVWLLPASAHSIGANGAFYTTTVEVANLGGLPASFTMKFLEHDRDGSAGPEQTFNLESGKSVIYFDVLGSVFGQTSSFGAIRITSDYRALNIVSVTSTPGFGGTFGQTIPAVHSSDLISAGSSRSILYIREGDGFRSNLVLASGAGVPTQVDVSLVSPEGVFLATKTYSIPANGMTQINRVVRDMGASGAITGARLVLSTSTPGAAFTGLASVIDEVTNDPTTIEAK